MTRHVVVVVSSMILVHAMPVFAIDAAYDMTAYWPQPAEGKTLVIRFDSGRFGRYRRLNDHFVLDDSWHRYTDADTPQTLIWSGRWHYRMDAARGMLEFQDDAPGKASKPLRAGYEIRWGKWLRIGQTIEHKVMFDGDRAPFAFHRLRLTAHLDTYRANGLQFDDVIRLEDVQIVCKNSIATPNSEDSAAALDCPVTSRSAGTYFLARGLGIVRIEDAVLDDVPDFVSAETAKAWCLVPSRTGDEYCR